MTDADAERGAAAQSLLTAHENGVLRHQWAVMERDRQPVFRAEVLLAERDAFLEVSQADIWRASYVVVLPEDHALTFDYAIDGATDHLHALAIAEQWLQEEMKA